METVSAFFMRNIVYVYFFYGLAFFALGLVVLLESGRTSEFRFARALLPLALFGLVHGAHEWFEMFQIFAAHETQNPAEMAADIFRIVTLVLSFSAPARFRRAAPARRGGSPARPSLAGGRAGRAVAGGRRVHRLAPSTQHHRTSVCRRCPGALQPGDPGRTVGGVGLAA